jgi:hypothetical protein
MDEVLSLKYQQGIQTCYAGEVNQVRNKIPVKYRSLTLSVIVIQYPQTAPGCKA